MRNTDGVSGTKKAGSTCLFCLLMVCVALCARDQRFELGIQAAFAARSFVAVDQAFVDGRVDDRHGGLERRGGFFFVASVDRGDDFFDESTQLAALSGVTCAAFFCLAGAFFC